jgi:hypothetical protein
LINPLCWMEVIAGIIEANLSAIILEIKCQWVYSHSHYQHFQFWELKQEYLS